MSVIRDLILIVNEFSNITNNRENTAPLFAAEIEFYINKDDILDMNHPFIQQFQKELLLNDKFKIENLEMEDGINQFEVQFEPTTDYLELSNWINEFREFASKNFNANFVSKPYINQPGSSIHFHISLHHNQKNLFLQNDVNHYDAFLPYTDLMYHSIAGILEKTPQNIHIFAPTQNCKTRFVYPKKGQHFIHYPTNCSWGVNNRTCAIRIPKKSYLDNMRCRIEHRISSSLADPEQSLNAIIESIIYGIINQIECPDPIFGNAFNQEYHHIKTLLD
jgi:glutamine synthetase